MTQEQKAQLLLAIDRAEGPGACSYMAGCVIAQLADIVDPSGETRAKLNASVNYIRNDTLRLWLGFGPIFLRKLQMVWDNDSAADDPDEARAKMRALVEAA